MSTPRIEFAGGSDLAAIQANRSHVLARAPAWVRQISDRRLRAAAAAKASSTSAPRASAGTAGWVWGLGAAGVSVPVRLPADPQDRPEQFNTEALEQMARQANRAGGDVPLVWDHHGPVLARNLGTDLVLRVVDLFGQPALAFEARLRQSPAAKLALEQLQAGLLGVSLEFNSSKSHLADRPGIGLVRVISQANLLGIALVPRASGTKAAYPACTAAGRQGGGIGPSTAMRDAVRHRAWEQLTRQAQAMR